MNRYATIIFAGGQTFVIVYVCQQWSITAALRKLGRLASRKARAES